jgi:hypothetical protein
MARCINCARYATHTVTVFAWPAAVGKSTQRPVEHVITPLCADHAKLDQPAMEAAWQAIVEKAAALGWAPDVASVQTQVRWGVNQRGHEVSKVRLDRSAARRGMRHLGGGPRA